MGQGQREGHRSWADGVVKKRVRLIFEVLLDYVAQEDDEKKVLWHPGNKEVEIWTKVGFLRKRVQSYLEQLKDPLLKNELQKPLAQDAETATSNIREALSQYIKDLLPFYKEISSTTEIARGDRHIKFKFWHEYEGPKKLEQFKQDNLEEFDKAWDKKAPPKREKKPKPPIAPINQPSNVPAGIRNPNLFVGRGNELEELHDKVQEQGQVAICAVAGMGGVGKTELAIQYARKYGAYYPKGICWLRGTDEQDIATQVVNFTLETFPDFNIRRDIPADGQVRVCWKYWLTNPPPEAMLIIVDDVTDYDKVRPYVPQDFPKMRVIFTTRWQLPGSNIEQFPLGVLEAEDALKLLKLVVGEDRIERELENAKRLCEWMEYLPLGLELVGWYLKQEPRLSIGEMIINLQQHRGLQHRAMRRDPNKPWTFTAERGVAAAFDLSWEKLDKETKRLGCLLSLFAAAPIPWQSVEMAEASRLAELGEDFNTEHLRTYRRNLRELHLLRHEGADTYRLHQLIRQFFREKLEESANGN